MTAPADHPLDLLAVATETLAAARAQPSGRTARTLTPGVGGALKQVLLGMTAEEDSAVLVTVAPTPRAQPAA